MRLRYTLLYPYYLARRWYYGKMLEFVASQEPLDEDALFRAVMKFVAASMTASGVFHPNCEKALK